MTDEIIGVQRGEAPMPVLSLPKGLEYKGVPHIVFLTPSWPGKGYRRMGEMVIQQSAKEA